MNNQLYIMRVILFAMFFLKFPEIRLVEYYLSKNWLHLIQFYYESICSPFLCGHLHFLEPMWKKTYAKLRPSFTGRRGFEK